MAADLPISDRALRSLFGNIEEINQGSMEFLKDISDVLELPPEVIFFYLSFCHSLFLIPVITSNKMLADVFCKTKNTSNLIVNIAYINQFQRNL